MKMMDDGTLLTRTCLTWVHNKQLLNTVLLF